MFFFFKQKTAYAMRISDWSSDVCSSDLFTVLNDERIIGVQYLNNAHSHIPFYFGISNDDTSAEHSKSPAETIQPLADFASFLMNIHIKACRKNVWGTTYYNPSAVDYSVVPDGEVAARVPIKAQGFNKDIRTLVYHEADRKSVG